MILLVERIREEIGFHHKPYFKSELILVVEHIMDNHRLFILSLAINLAFWLDTLAANKAIVSNLSRRLLIILVQIQILVLLYEVHNRLQRFHLSLIVLGHLRNVALLLEDIAR